MQGQSPKGWACTDKGCARQQLARPLTNGAVTTGLARVDDDYPRQGNPNREYPWPLSCASYTAADRERLLEVGASARLRAVDELRSAVGT